MEHTLTQSDSNVEVFRPTIVSVMCWWVGRERGFVVGKRSQFGHHVTDCEVKHGFLSHAFRSDRIILSYDS